MNRRRWSSVAVALLVLAILAFVLPSRPVVTRAEDGDSSASTQEKIQAARESIQSLNRDLMIEGKYNCCISPGCEFCTIAYGECPCMANMVAEMPVCGTCKAGWDGGHGGIPGFDPAKVRGPNPDEAKEMYDRRKEALSGQ